MNTMATPRTMSMEPIRAVVDIEWNSLGRTERTPMPASHGIMHSAACLMNAGRSFDNRAHQPLHSYHGQDCRYRWNVGDRTGGGNAPRITRLSSRDWQSLRDQAGGGAREHRG